MFLVRTQLGVSDYLEQASSESSTGQTTRAPFRENTSYGTENHPTWHPWCNNWAALVMLTSRYLRYLTRAGLLLTSVSLNLTCSCVNWSVMVCSCSWVWRCEDRFDAYADSSVLRRVTSAWTWSFFRWMSPGGESKVRLKLWLCLRSPVYALWFVNFLVHSLIKKGKFQSPTIGLPHSTASLHYPSNAESEFSQNLLRKLKSLHG